MVKRAEGYIEEVNASKMLAKVRFPQQDDHVSDWLQMGFNGPDEEFDYRKDDYVGCLMDDDFDDGWIICRLYPEDASLSGAKITKKKFRDGSEISYDENTNTYKMDIQGNQFQVKPGEIKLETEIAGSFKITPGMIEADGSGAGAQFNVAHSASISPVFGTALLNCSQTIKVGP